MSKIFILGLPRTGTTSLCALFLEKGYKTAHTAYTKKTFELADVVADSPVFCDYAYLDTLFPNSKFVYLDRNEELWLASAREFLKKAADKMNTRSRGFNPVISRAFKTVFQLDAKKPDSFSDAHLLHCFKQHKAQVENYFRHRSTDLLTVEIASSELLTRLSGFFQWEEENQTTTIPHLNRSGRIIAWDNIKHPLKISSNASGEERRKFFDYQKTIV